MGAKSIPGVAASIYDLLEPLDSRDRQRAIAGTMAMLGEVSSGLGDTGVEESRSASGARPDDELGRKASRWTSANGLTRDQLEHVFHFNDDGTVDVLEGDIWGASKKAKTLNVYMLLGVSRLLSTDNPTFDDAAALDLCKRLGCHDSANHAKNRDSLGNRVTGSRQTGFTLTTPGLREAADVIKRMATGL